jgi:phosphoserine phosphatase RsbU/P
MNEKVANEADGVKKIASILAVDDTPANLQVLTGMLKDRGYKVRPVPSGKLALLAARHEAPDLILLDINMPDMTGFEVCRALKADAALKDIPVIFISALTEPLDKANAFALGGVDYLTKPFQIDELHARVNTHLNIRRLHVALEESNAQLATINQRMSRDLKAAARIQRTFLPRMELNVAGAGFAWVYRPCDELAGDGLNVIALGDGRVALYVLDVSGHGVTAALLSVALCRLLSPESDPSSILSRGGSGVAEGEVPAPLDVVHELNRLFPFDTATAQFATLIYGIWDPKTQEFRYVSAGHPGPVHVPKDGKPVTLESQGFPIGLGTEPYVERVVRVEAGDRLYLLSDGVIEAMSPMGRVYGQDRLMATIGAGGKDALSGSVTQIMKDLDVWHDSERAKDDISILAMEVWDERLEA